MSLKQHAFTALFVACLLPSASADVSGESIYTQSCATCHGGDGDGWHQKNGPGLVGVDWVIGDASRLIRLTLGGLYQRIPLGNGTHYGVMPGFKDVLDDDQVAAVLSYIRRSWGNSAAPISPELVATLRPEAEKRTFLYSAADFGLEAKGKVGPAGEALLPPGNFAQAGFKTYLTVCVGCHQINGRGLATGNGHGFSPLVESDVVKGPQNTLIRVVLGGLEGKNNPTGGAPNETMPPWGMGMSDEQTAQVLTFIRQAWGHASGAVSPQAVARLRQETRERGGKFWNPEDLKAAEARDRLRDESTVSR